MERSSKVRVRVRVRVTIMPFAVEKQGTDMTSSHEIDDVDVDDDAVRLRMKGMEIAIATCDKAAAAVELFVRSSITLPRRPAVLIMDAQVDQSAKLPLKAMHQRNKRWAILWCAQFCTRGGWGGEGEAFIALWGMQCTR